MGIVSSTVPLRDYQMDCIRLTSEAILAQKGRGYHYVLPTGTGKTEISQELLASLAERCRVLAIAHTRDLIFQTARRISQRIDDVGIVMAERNDLDSRCVVGSIQTLDRGRFTKWLTCGDVEPSLVWIDECHHITSKNRYAALLEELWALYPNCPVVGCTATDFRSDGEVFQEILPICTFYRSIADMQRLGWLAKTIWNPVMIPESFSGIKKSRAGGEEDYNTDALDIVMQGHSSYIVSKSAELIGNRPTVVFGASVKHAQELAGLYEDFGIPAACVWGDMPKVERELVLAGWKSGEIQLVANVGVLCEGFDYSDIAAVVIARPTLSPGRYLQMLGRGTRLKAGDYTDCLVIDVCDNANLLDSRQVTLPKISSVIPETEHGTASELIRALEEEEDSEKKQNGHTVKPRSVRLGDWSNVTWTTWGFDKVTGVYYMQMGNNTHFVGVFPDPKGSGLYYPMMFTKNGKWGREKITDLPCKLNQVMQHINLLAAKSGVKKLIDKNDPWRYQAATPAQLGFLSSLDAEAGRQARSARWNKGEVSQAIVWGIIKPAIYKTLGL